MQAFNSDDITEFSTRGPVRLFQVGHGLQAVLVEQSAPPALGELQEHADASRRLSALKTVAPADMVQASFGVGLRLKVGDAVPLSCLPLPLPAEQVARIGALLAGALQALHRVGYVHRGLVPWRIYFSESRDRLWLGGLGWATSLTSSTVELSAAGAIAGDLCYLSPEQTGRVNRVVDERSDLYTIGIILYELLVGAPPFDAAEPLELVHAQLAREPPPPPSAPGEPGREALSAILRRLLSKDAGARYQSAYGLREDLAAVAGRRSPSGSWSAVGPSRRGTLRLTERLYGREAELERLQAACERVCQGGTELMLVAGYSGVGKTALVQDLYRPITLARGFFVAGKQDIYQRSTPLAALAEALDALAVYLLSQKPSELERWRAILKDAVAGQGAALLELVPRLAPLLGPQPPLPDLGPRESRNRFMTAFLRFVDVVASRSHPLVIFLDDLQWADPGLFELIEKLIIGGEERSLLIIGAYRSNEVDSDHPLYELAAELLPTGRVRTLQLEGLKRADLLALLGDALHPTSEPLAPLATLVHERTAGNPFFLRAFLSACVTQRRLRFEEASGSWTWDMEAMRGVAHTENVVVLTQRELSTFSARTQGVLQVAACAGNSFDLALLASATGQSPKGLLLALSGPARRGLLTPLTAAAHTLRLGTAAPADLRFAFPHDKIQEAAYQSIPPEQRSFVHLRIARLLIAATDGAPSDDSLFDIVGHLQLAAEEITTPDEAAASTRLLIRAGEKAERACAYSAAEQCFSAALALLPTAALAPDSALHGDIAMGLARAWFCLGDPRRGLSFLEGAADRAGSSRQRIDILHLKSMLETNAPDVAAALESTLTALAEAGFAIPATDMRAEVLASALANHSATTVRAQLAELRARGPVDDPRKRAALNLMIYAYLPLFQAQEMALAGLVILWAFERSVTWGTTPSTGLLLVYMGALIAQEGELRAAYDLSTAGVAMVDGDPDPHFKARTHFGHALWVAHLGQPLSSTVDTFLKAYRLGVESGDMMYAAFTVANSTTTAALAGWSLPRLEALMESERRRGQAVHYVDDAIFFELFERGVRALSGPRPGSWSTPEFDEVAHWARIDAELPVLAAWLAPLKLLALAVDGSLEEAVRWGHRYIDRMAVLPTSYFAHLFEFLYAWAARCTDQEPERAAEIADRVQARAAVNPGNYSWQLSLLQAELAAASGDLTTATRLWERGAEAAEHSGFLYVPVLASERAAACWRQAGVAVASKAYQVEAERARDRWTGKGAAREPTPEAVELLAVFKAAQAMSAELDPDRLVERIVDVMRLATGAQRAALFQEHNEGLQITARAGESLGPIPLSIIRFAQHSGELVRLDDAGNVGPFSGDPVVRDTGLRSVLVVPVAHAERTLGWIYLENNLAAGIFPDALTPVLQALSGQAAISLRTAQMVASMREQEHQLRREESRLRSMMEASNLGIWCLEFTPSIDTSLPMAAISALIIERGRLSEFSRGFTEMYKPEHTEGLIGSSLTELAWLESGSEARLRAFAQGGFQARGVEVIVTTGGFKHTVLRNVRGVVEDGRLVRVWGADVDITEQRTAEQALAHARKLDGLGQLAGGIAHDFNNLLTAILIGAQMATYVPDIPEEAREILEDITAGAERARGLTSKLLTFSRQGAVTPEAVDLHTVIRGSMDLLERTLEKRITMKLSLEAGESTVLGDAGQLQNILINLGLNARDAIAGIGQIHVHTRAATLGGVPAIELDFTDNGSGIPEEHLSSIFDPFFTTKEVGKGTGLGLAEVYGSLSRMGGEVSVKTHPGEGTTFTLRLPLTTPRSKPIEAVLPGEDAGTALVIDDEPGVRTALRAALTLLGWTVHTAESGPDALRRFGERLDEMDITVMDVAMPEMEPLVLLRSLLERRADLPVLICSGYADMAVIDALLAEGARGLLAKPFGTGQLRQALKSMKQRRETP